jgi:hypothetical protein
MDRTFPQHFKVVLGSNEWQLIAFIDEGERDKYNRVDWDKFLKQMTSK